MRKAEESDLLAVYRIEQACFPQPWPYASFERFVGEPAFLVATREDAVLGYIVADVTPNYGRDLGHVKDLAVHPEAQGAGVGRRLLTAALVRLTTAGAAVVKLEVRAGNAPAKSLYHDVGFEPVRQIPGYYDDGEAAVIMTLDLSEWTG